MSEALLILTTLGSAATVVAFVRIWLVKGRGADDRWEQSA